MDQNVRRGGRPVYIVNVQWDDEEAERRGTREEEVHADFTAILSWVSRAEFEEFEGRESFRAMKEWRAEEREIAAERLGKVRRVQGKKEKGTRLTMGPVGRMKARGRPKGSRVINGKLVYGGGMLDGVLGMESDEEMGSSAQWDEEGENSGGTMEKGSGGSMGREEDGAEAMEEDEDELDVAKTGVYGPVEPTFYHDIDLGEDLDDQENDDMEDDPRPSTSSRQIPLITLETPIPNRNRNGKLISRARSSSQESVSRHISRGRLKSSLAPSKGRKHKHFADTRATSTNSESSSELQLRAETYRKRNAQSRSSGIKKQRPFASKSASPVPPSDSASIVELDNADDEEQEQKQDEDDGETPVAEEVINISISYPQIRKYLIKWSRPAGKETWEDAEDLGDIRDLIEKFHNRFPELTERMCQKMESDPEYVDWRLIKEYHDGEDDSDADG